MKLEFPFHSLIWQLPVSGGHEKGWWAFNWAETTKFLSTWSSHDANELTGRSGSLEKVVMKGGEPLGAAGALLKHRRVFDEKRLLEKLKTGNTDNRRTAWDVEWIIPRRCFVPKLSLTDRSVGCWDEPLGKLIYQSCADLLPGQPFQVHYRGKMSPTGLRISPEDC